MASSPSPIAAAVKICYNTHCKEPRSELPRRKAWKIRSGDHAELCERCYSAYELGKFCESFHADMSGWRKCESCDKRVHCGCIVSLARYILLDVGGVECMVCARKTIPSMQNHFWQPHLHLHSQTQGPDKPKEYPVKSWNQATGSFPGQWRQQSHLWSGPQSELQQRLAYELDRRPNAEKFISVSRSPLSSQDKRITDFPERQASSSLTHATRDRYGNGITGDTDPMSIRKGMMPNPCSTSSPGINSETQPNSSGKMSSVKGHPPAFFGLASSLSSDSSPNGATHLGRISPTQPQGQMTPLLRQIPLSPHNISDSCSNGKSRADARTRALMLPRYWPRITDQELQQISGDSNSVITPLFEKMLSASDAGRIGRLVLPKKCAEAYFPTISQPEGLPLKVQDAGGKEWAFQFRFWPNNNSRMYVLEGVTPCIQSMNLQAGDTVTFSRIDPEGKLVMGFRKASGTSAEQENQTVKSANGSSTPPEIKCSAEVPANGHTEPEKGSLESLVSGSAVDQSNSPKTGFIQKDGSSAKSSQGPTKRKSSTFGCKSKRLQIENGDSIELKLTWEEAQELLRPPPDYVPSIVFIAGHEFEEYVAAPVFGKPTIFTTSQDGDTKQWAQCEECSKWRKLPVDSLLPSRFTCKGNKWDAERSSCSAAQEMSAELTDMLSAKTATRKSKVKVENNDNFAAGLDTLATFAILGEEELLPASNQETTRHPRHKIGCTCIVCIQPPSGKGKHKPTCTCNVCLTVKRRFTTLMLRREKRLSEKEAETSNAGTTQTDDQPPEDTMPSITGSSWPQKNLVNLDEGMEDELEKKRKSLSPLMAQIDLNIQPEREEEPSPVANPSGAALPFQDVKSLT